MGEIFWRDRVCDYAAGLGWLCRAIVYPGRRGAPDRMFIRNGVVIFVEFKDIDTDLDPLQVRERRKLQTHGAKVYRVRTFQEGKRLFDSFK